MEHDPPELQHRKQDIFWSVYTIVNFMSLRLGRASVIQACDVDIPSPFECFPNMGVWSMVCALWARQAVIQNNIYINLYSPAALNQPESERVMHARQLAVEMQRDVLEPFDVSKSPTFPSHCVVYFDTYLSQIADFECRLEYV